MNNNEYYSLNDIKVMLSSLSDEEIHYLNNNLNLTINDLVSLYSKKILGYIV